MPPERHLPRPIVVSALLVGVAVLITLAWQPIDLEPRPRAPLVTVGFDGVTRVVPASGVRWLGHWSRTHFDAGEAANLDAMTTGIEAEMDRLFGRAHDRVPEFADWYFSLGGEYTRLLMPLLDRAGDQIAFRAEQALFGEHGFAAPLQALQRDLDRILVERTRATRETWLSGIGDELDRLSLRSIPSAARAEAIRIDLDALAMRITGFDDPALGTRVGASSTVGAGAVVAPAIASAVTRRGARGAAAVGRPATRAAGRGTSILACAATGPAALGCALVAGTAAWVGTDWLLLRVDEARNREAFEAELHAALEATREELVAALVDQYRQRLRVLHAAHDLEIEHAFVPAYHLRVARGAGAAPTAPAIKERGTPP